MPIKVHLSSFVTKQQVVLSTYQEVMTFVKAAPHYNLWVYSSRTPDRVFYHLEKRRKKVRVVGKEREVVKKAHWVVTLYSVPMAFVLYGKQHKRNFELVIG